MKTKYTCKECKMKFSDERRNEENGMNKRDESEEDIDEGMILAEGY